MKSGLVNEDAHRRNIREATSIDFDKFSFLELSMRRDTNSDQ
jgi:hypothetical protein